MAPKNTCRAEGDNKFNIKACMLTRAERMSVAKKYSKEGVYQAIRFFFSQWGTLLQYPPKKTNRKKPKKKQYKKYAAEQVLPGKQFAKHRVNFFGWLGEGYCFAIPPPTRTILYQIRGFNKANAFFVGEMGGGGIVFLPGPHKHLKKPKKSTNNKSG